MIAVAGRWTHAHSAGGVVIRDTDDDREFLAIRPAGGSRWQLPKGTLDPNESSESAAVREVREEGGVDGRIVTPLEPIVYFFRHAGRQIRKQVDFYVMAYVGGDPADHDHEVDDARWFPVAEFELLTFPSERRLVQEAMSVMDTMQQSGTTTRT
jgi:8-oxo-dGTP pyrophosphatase MutT (NUDIX family)